MNGKIFTFAQLVVTAVSVRMLSFCANARASHTRAQHAFTKHILSDMKIGHPLNAGIYGIVTCQCTLKSNKCNVKPKVCVKNPCGVQCVFHMHTSARKNSGAITGTRYCRNDYAFGHGLAYKTARAPNEYQVN